MPPRRLPPNCYQRGDTIWGRIKVAGIEYRGSLRTDNAAEAKIRLAAWRQKIERAALGAEDAPSFKAAVVKWTREVLPGAVKPAVRRRYLTSVDMLTPVFGTLRVSQIDERQISRYISSRAGEVTNATIRRDLTALSKLLSACIVWGWIDRNPARSYDRSIIKEQRRTLTLPTDDEIDYALKLAPPHMARLLRFLALTGMRENEAVTLEAKDVDWTARTITLVRTKSSRPRALNWKTPAGDAADALAPLTGRKSGLLFPNRDGLEYSNISSNFGKVMRDAVRRAEDEGLAFRRWRAHDLRHRFAVRWLKQGGDIYRLSRHLGHSSVKTTEGYLEHLTDDEHDTARGVAQKVAQPQSKAAE
jgi:integrase/recombinase XerD